MDRIIFISMYFDCRRCEELSDEILARTLDASGSRVGREMVWRFSRSQRALELQSQQNGSAIQINCLEQEFCIHRISIEVNSTSAFLVLQDPTTQKHWY